MKKLIILLGAFLLLGCVKEHFRCEERYSVFDGDLGVVRRWTSAGGRAIDTELELTFNKPGVYSFVVWKEQYRSNDKMVDGWEEKVKEVPTVVTMVFPTPAYRLEIVWAYDDDIQAKSLEFVRRQATWLYKKTGRMDQLQKVRITKEWRTETSDRR